jgi:hypothetical protein
MRKLIFPMQAASNALFAMILLVIGAAGCSNSDDSSDSGNAASTTPNPVVTEASGGRNRASGGLRYDVTQFGYEEREYFFEGTARTYAPSTEPPKTYRSRMIVWTPKDPARFNGTTVVEWAHVSVGDFELTYDVKAQSSMLIEQGYAFVLVSAQQRGICSEGASGCPSSSLRGVDPERYGTLNHPGDDYSFDIFNQALQAIKYPTGTAPLGNLATQFIIAEGFQMMRDRSSPLGNPNADTPPLGVSGPLNAYQSNGAAEARLADAFLIDSAAPLVEPAQYVSPTLHHLDESAIRRTPVDNGPNHITWEIVGLPHLDLWAASLVSVPKPGALPPLLSREEEEALRVPFEDFGQAPGTVEKQCTTSYTRQYTLAAALAALRHWLETGVRPAEPPHIERVGPPPTSAGMRLSRDGNGNAIGGLRSPIVDVPVATYNAESCGVSGTMTPFSPERLAELYPTHRSYVEQLLVATDAAVDGGILLCHDAQIIMRKASESLIGGDDQFTAAPACATNQ